MRDAISREIRRVSGVDSRTKRAITRSAAGRGRAVIVASRRQTSAQCPNKLLVSRGRARHPIPYDIPHPARGQITIIIIS